MTGHTECIHVTKPKTCRLPTPAADLLEQAAAEQGWLQSELIRNAIRYYMAENPDNIRAFTKQQSAAENKRRHNR